MNAPLVPLVPVEQAGPGKFGVFHLITQRGAMMSRQSAALNTFRCFVSFRHEPKFKFLRSTRGLNTDDQGEGAGASFGAAGRCWWRLRLKIASSGAS